MGEVTGGFSHLDTKPSDDRCNGSESCHNKSQRPTTHICQKRPPNNILLAVNTCVLSSTIEGRGSCSTALYDCNAAMNSPIVTVLVLFYAIVKWRQMLGQQMQALLKRHSLHRILLN